LNKAARTIKKMEGRIIGWIFAEGPRRGAEKRTAGKEVGGEGKDRPWTGPGRAERVRVSSSRQTRRRVQQKPTPSNKTVTTLVE
jgi:hypothetical protein